jgi:predicted RNase H-like HicB family nuclease
MNCRDLVRMVEAAGWVLFRTKGSYQHTVIRRVPESSHSLWRKTWKRCPAGNSEQHFTTGWAEMTDKQYVIVIEKAADGSYSAYVPDLPGCVSCGDTLDKLRVNIEEAVQDHIDALRDTGQPVPQPSTMAATVHAA